LTVTSQHIDERFFFLCLQPYLNAINAETSSITVKHLSSRTVEAIPLPLPPLAEQRRLVEKLEALFSELDKGVESLHTARAQLEVYRQALLKHAFQGKLTAGWREKNADARGAVDEFLTQVEQEREGRHQQALEDWKARVAEWERQGKPGRKPPRPRRSQTVEPLSDDELTALPELPPGWRWTKLGLIAEIGTGATPLKAKKARYYDGGTVPWVTSGALNDPFVREPSGHVTEAALDETNLSLFPPHTLLMAMYGEGKTRGKCSELTIEATTNQAIAGIQLEGAANAIRRFIKWFLTKNYETIRLGSSGGVQPNLNLGIIANTPVPVCSAVEATKVTSAIESELSVVEKLRAEIDVQLRNAELLRQGVLKRAFNGCLVAQDASDEPASVLLDRIRAERDAQTNSDKQRKAAS
jgi:type I restriction enzyme S subunit